MMTPLTIAQQRLFNQRIAPSNLHAGLQTPCDVVHWLGAVQAQDYASAAWTIGCRLPGATQVSIDQAFVERTLVRTWLLRGTLHLVTAADLRWMLTLLSPSLVARFAASYRKHEFDAEFMTRSYDALAKILEGGQQLTRKEVVAALEASGIPLDAERAGVLLNRAAIDGLLCLGNTRGKQQTFTLLDEWLPPTAPCPREEALAALALRYFNSHGPTTFVDFAWWTGLFMPEAKIGFEAVKSQLVAETIEGKIYWRAPGEPTSFAASPTVHLLAGFDEFMLGYGDRRAVVEAHHEKTIMGVNAVFAYTMILDGQVVGTWKRTLRKSAVEVTLSPFAPLPSTLLQAFAAAAEPYGQFLGLPVIVQS